MSLVSRRARRGLTWVSFSVLLGSAHCGGSVASGGSTDSGGSAASGGSTDSGGSAASGGRAASGGNRASGGSAASGGSPRSGAGNGGASGVSTGGVGNRPGAGGSSPITPPDATPGDTDACSPQIIPLNPVSNGTCTAELPSGLDLGRLEVDTVVGGVAQGEMYLPLRRFEEPCTATSVGYRVLSPKSIELCGLCATSLGLGFRAVEHCSAYPPPVATPVDACVPEQVTLHIRMGGSACFLDLPPHTDLSVPIDLAGEFGMLPMTYHVSETPGTCDAPDAGWVRTATPGTIQICGQACSVFGLAPYTVTLECGAHVTGNDGGAR